MSPIAPIEPGAALPQREPQQQRSSADFGGAVTHRDKVREKLRVDPPSLAEKKLRAQHLRSSDPAKDRPGQYVDVEV